MNNRLNKILTAVLLTVALAVCQTGVFAQTVKKISVAKGTTSTLKGTGNQTYEIRLEPGQTLKIQFVPTRKTANLEVLDGQGSDLTEGSDGRSFEASFEEAVDLKINISENGKAAFTLKVTVK